MKKVILFLLSTLFLMACTSMESKEERDVRSQVEGKTYLLDGTIAGSEIDITFNEDQISGSAGVNRYFAPYNIEGDNISVQVVGTTRRMGPEDFMKQEMRYTKSIEEAEKISVAGDKLTITSKNGKTLIFTEKELSLEEALSGKTFTLEGSLEGHDITINFSEGRISGNSGVNNYSAAYELEEGKITVSPQILSTMMAGPVEAMERESEYLKDLAQADTVEVSEGKLIITLKDGKKLIFE